MSTSQRMKASERRPQVAKKYLEGWTQPDLAKEYGVNQSTISRDLEAIRQEWMQSAVIDFNEIKARELARIDRLEREYWQAWERSCEDAETAVQKAVETPIGVRKEATKTAKGQSGNPSFLAGVQWCIEQRLKIFGIYEATKLKIESWQDEIVQLLRDGRIKPEDVVAGWPSLADELFARAGIHAHGDS